MVEMRIAFQASARAAAVELLTDYKASVGITLQIYPGRPRSLLPPTAFVDRITEDIDYMAASFVRQRNIVVEVVVVWGLFDSKEAVDQKDAFVDSFLNWVTDRYHAAGANTTIGLRRVEDEPAWQPDWRPANTQNGPEPVYYATRLRLEGFAGG